MSELRDRWEVKVSWSDGTFDSLERFVDNKPEENIQSFIETGDLEDLYGDIQKPSPLPQSKHQEYMREYAKKEYE